MTKPLRSVTAETTDASLRRDLRALHWNVLDDTILTKVVGWRAAMDFFKASRAEGGYVCEMVPLVARGRSAKVDPWAYWFCVHPTGRCRGAGVVLWQVCPCCNERYTPRRTDQHTCGRDRCRQALSRQRRRAVARQSLEVA